MRYRLYILSAAVLFSTGGAAIKACTLTGWQVAEPVGQPGNEFCPSHRLFPIYFQGLNRRFYPR